MLYILGAAKLKLSVLIDLNIQKKIILVVSKQLGSPL
jgi:hypothetical protein